MAQRLSELADGIALENRWQISSREVIFDHGHLCGWLRPAESPAGLARELEAARSRLQRAELSWPARQKVLSCFTSPVG